jgi:enoyl-CoA hydratase/carnithine racemase
MPSILSADPRLAARVEAPVGWLAIDNPERRNALTLSMWQALPDVVAALVREPAVRAIVVRGAGEAAFVAGADISEFETVRRDAASARAYEASNDAAFAAIRQAAKPTIAMIRGFCIGGGVGIAAAADLRVAAEDALFAIPAARLGLAYPPAAVGDIVRLVGPARAKDLFFTARRFDAAEALRIGLVDRVVAAADLEQATRALAATIAENAPKTVIAAKTAIDAIAGAPGAAGIEAALALAEACFDSRDFAEGRAAFLEKRRPVFRGE